MAFNPAMDDAVSGAPASSSDYNLLIDNILDLNTRMTDGTSGNTALSTKVNSGTIGNTALGALVNSGSVGNTALGALVNHITKGNNALDTRVTALEAASAAVGAWVPITTFSGTWANRTTGGDFMSLKVRILPGNNIQILGSIWKPSGSAVNGEQMFTLAAAYRPTHEVFVPVTLSNTLGGALHIYPTGVVEQYTTNPATTVHIDGFYPGPSSGA